MSIVSADYDPLTGKVAVLSAVPLAELDDVRTAGFIGVSPNGKRLLFSAPGTTVGNTLTFVAQEGDVVVGEARVMYTPPWVGGVVSLAGNHGLSVHVGTIALGGRQEDGQ